MGLSDLICNNFYLAVDGGEKIGDFGLHEKGGHWNRVIESMEQSGVIERPWLTTIFGPACGPALRLYPFALLAKGAWKRHSNQISNDPENTDVTTLYWHILDHGRKSGKWAPPLSKLK